MNRIDIINTLHKYELNNTKYMVLSGAAMVLYGIKDSTDDIDISLDDTYYDELLTKYDCVLEMGKDDVYYIDNVINFGRDYYNKEDIVYVDNIPVQSIDAIIKLKKSLNRDKDIKDLSKIDKYLNKSSLVLAYLGDSIYEVYIRKYLLNKDIPKVDMLNKEATKYVSARGQASYLKKMIDNNYLTDIELEIIKRARNHKSRNPKNTDIVTYKNATGLEALIGYLELTYNKNRIDEIMDYILKED